MTLRAKTLSSRRWLERQNSDPYTQKAKHLGYRSRSAFKLLEIQKKDQLLRKGMTVVDLGAAPGGFAQVAANIVGQSGKVIALDRLTMDPLNGVDIIHGDFQEEAVFMALLSCLAERSVDLVMSDMAPNISGIRSADQPRSLYLAELALDFAEKVLKDGGSLLVKVFQGEGVTEYSAILKRQFKKVSVRKPDSSRKESREIYFLAQGYGKKERF